MLRSLKRLLIDNRRVFSWRRIIKGNEGRLWRKAVSRRAEHPRVLIATSLGGNRTASFLESSLAVALTLRGSPVDIFLCDGVLPACMRCRIKEIPPEQLLQTPRRSLCRACVSDAKSIYAPLGLAVHWFSKLISARDREEASALARSVPVESIPDYRYDGLAVGEHAYAGALRYFARGDLKREEWGEAIARRYLEASLLTVMATRNLLKRTPYDVSCFHHGIYVPQGLVGEVCRKFKVRVVNWNQSYRESTFVFSHGDTYHHTMVSEPVSSWESLPFPKEREERIMAYLKSRWYGTNDWIGFQNEPQEDLKTITRETGIDFSRPCIGMLTSVIWDAQLHYDSNAFVNMLEWVKFTIRYFAKRPELQLALRVHPAEVSGMIPSRQLMVDEIKRTFPVLPRNVFVIPPESKISTYRVMEQCNAVIIYNTKTGIEISSMGVPVVVAGEAWIRNKGIGIDVSSADEYERILDTLPLRQPMSPEMTARARRYAYHFFYRRMIPVGFVTKAKDKFAYDLKVSSVNDFVPGKDKGLDCICEGIINGTPFIYDEG